MSGEQPALPQLGNCNPKLIFVVDDETMIGEVVELILRLEGYEPKFFQNPESAYHCFVSEEPKPALLLTDFLMSPINGMELIQRCKKVVPGLKTILYSGNVREDIMQYYPIKADGFLSKPFLPKILVGTVQSVLTRDTAPAPIPKP